MAAAELNLAAFSVTLAGETDFSGWRDAARRLVLNDIPPDDVSWIAGGSRFPKCRLTAS
jgi:hypothetical protein